MFENAPHERPACNLCGGTSVRIIRADNFVECVACRLRFYSPRPTWQALVDTIWHPGNKEGLEKEAVSMFERGTMWGEPADRSSHMEFVYNYYRGFLDVIKKHRPELDSVFEIGGSIGRFLQIARDDYGVSTCDGCEINAEAVKIANTKMRLPGVVPGDFLACNVSRKYDCVVALDYIEHTYHPNDDLAKANSMLRPGGLLALKTFLEDVNQSMVDYPQNGFSIIHWDVHSDNQVFLVARKHAIPSYYGSRST